ncbi:hypothetical protein KC364_g39 [Hortaea werneckii]|nr:hypothetical protein KC364_g39 [Hortaea werneckii]
MDATIQAIYQDLASGPALVLGLAVITYLYYLYASSWRVIPKDIPWFFSESGYSSAPSWYAQIRAHFSDFDQGVNSAHQGYKKFSKSGMPFVVPSFISWQPEVVLPPAHIQWLVEQPDTVLSINEALIKDLEFRYTTPAAWSFTRPFHVEALNKLRMESLIPDMAEEVQDSIDRVWGTDTENWNEVNIEETMRHVLVQITARVIVGSPLCRNTEYIENAHSFMVEMCPRAVCIGFTPELLRPLAGWWFSRPLKQWNAVCAKYMIPLVKQEMAHRRPSDQKTMPAPKTLLEQMARIAVRSTDPRDTDPFSISSRLLGLNFVAVHTSCASLTNAVLDIMSPPAGESVYRELRTEAKTVHDSCQGNWTKARVNQLEKIDSALRESLRISTFKARGLERVVVAPKGVTLPDGTHLRKGTKIGTSMSPYVSTAPVPQKPKTATIRAPQRNTAMSSSSTPAKRSSHLDMGSMPAQVASWQLMSSNSSSPTSRCIMTSSRSSRDLQMPISVTSMLELSIPSRSALTDFSHGVIEQKQMLRSTSSININVLCTMSCLGSTDTLSICNRPFINSRRTLATYTLTSSAVHGFGAPNLGQLMALTRAPVMEVDPACFLQRLVLRPSPDWAFEKWFGLPTSAPRGQHSRETSGPIRRGPPGFRFLQNRLALVATYLGTTGHAHTRRISDTHQSIPPL